MENKSEIITQNVLQRNKEVKNMKKQQSDRENRIRLSNINIVSEKKIEWRRGDIWRDNGWEFFMIVEEYCCFLYLWR